MTFVLKYRYAYLCLFCLGLQNSVSGDKEMALRLEKGGGERERERQGLEREEADAKRHF